MRKTHRDIRVSFHTKQEIPQTQNNDTGSNWRAHDGQYGMIWAIKYSIYFHNTK